MSIKSIIPVSDAVPSRIASNPRTSTVRQRLIKEYGVDVGKVGTLTPDTVRASSMRAKSLKQQEKLAAKYSANAEQISASLNNLEQTRLGMLNAGSGSLKASDRMLGQAIMTNAKLESSMKSQAQKLAGDLAVEGARSGHALAEQQATLDSQLKAMAATHDAQLNLIAFQGKQNLNQGVAGIKDRYNAAREDAQYAREFDNYLDGVGGLPRFKLPSFSAKGLFR